MVKLQRNIDRRIGVVMDGRDIGSVVFPNADIKLFLTASDTVRANRRFEEMINNGLSVSYDEILNNIRNRDKLDSSRKVSPLVIPEDAFVIDTSEMDLNEVVEKVLSELNNRGLIT